MAKVNVIMSVYNQAKYVQKSIESILAQDFRDFSLIIINDGSTDESDAIISAFTDERINYLNNKTNNGLIYSLNLGLEEALKSNCTYIARMDSDDIAIADRFSQQVSYLDNNPEVGLLGSGVQFFGSTKKKNYVPQTQRKIVATFFCYNPFFHPTVMFRKALVTHRRYDFNFPKYEDYGLWIEFIGACKFHNLPNLLLNYRAHEGSVTSTYKHENLADYDVFMRLLRHLISKLNISLTEKELMILGTISSPSRAKIHSNIPLTDLKEVIFTIVGKTDDLIVDQRYLDQLLVERTFFYLVWNKRWADIFKLFYLLKRVKVFAEIAKSIVSGKKWVVN